MPIDDTFNLLDHLNDIDRLAGIFRRETDMTFTDFRTLHTIAQLADSERSAMVGVIANERGGVTQQAIGKTLRNLEADNMINMVMPPSDRRARFVTLTAKGERCYQRHLKELDRLRKKYGL